MADTSLIGDREWVGQYSQPPLGLLVHKAGVLADADANDVTVRMETTDGSTVLFERTATHTATGTYETILSSGETAEQGLFKITWTYAIDGVPQTFSGLLEVGATSAAYDALDVGFRNIVESVYSRFADLFDSPLGGPHLQVYFQTRFGRPRMAQLLGQALGRLNTIAQPHMTYSLDPEVNVFPYNRWGPLLEQALYVETIKHLIRSYVEQPDVSGTVSMARLDRRDYMDRWKSVLDMETADLQSALDNFKIAHMGFGRPHVLVSGGVYGNFGPTRIAGSAAARPRYWARFY